MSALKRLELIELIARDLQSRFVTSDINAYLSGYGIAANEESVASKRIYVKNLLSVVDNSVLQGIADDLDIEFEGSLDKKTGNTAKPNSEDIKSIWKDDNFRLFISHLSADKERASALKKCLKPYGISCFVAHNDIEPTTEWQIELEKALNSMDALTAIITSDFSNSLWTDQEVGWALGRGIPIIPLNRGNNPYGFMGKYQALQTKGKDASQVAGEMLVILRKNPKTKQKMEECYSHAVIKRFVVSGSYVQANKNMDELETVTYITPENVKRLKTSVKENSQLKNATNVQERFAGFIPQNFSKFF